VDCSAIEEGEKGGGVGLGVGGGGIGGIGFLHY
jgi:hypothetical protein